MRSTVHELTHIWFISSGNFQRKKNEEIAQQVFPASRTFAYKNIQEDVLYTEPTHYKSLLLQTLLMVSAIFILLVASCLSPNYDAYAQNDTLKQGQLLRHHEQLISAGGVFRLVSVLRWWPVPRNPVWTYTSLLSMGGQPRHPISGFLWCINHR